MTTGTSNDGGYTPPETNIGSSENSFFGMKAKPNTTRKTLNKRAVVVVASVLSVFLLFVILNAFSPKEDSAPMTHSRGFDPVPSERISSLPDHHSKLRRDEPKAMPVIEIHQPPAPAARRLSELEELERKQKIEAAKRVYAARSSDLSFKGVMMPKQGGATGGTIPASFQGGFLGGDSASSMNPDFMGGNPRDEANRQDDKLLFLEMERRGNTHVQERIKPLLTPYELQAGSIIPALLLTGINSDLPGQIVAQVSQNVFDTPTGAHLLVPQGTRLIGSYDSRVTYGQERVLLVWTRMLFPNGRSISLEGMPGVDLSGFAGVKDRVNNHYGKLITGVILGSVIGAGAQIAEGSYNRAEPTFEGLAVAGAAKNINQAGQEITRKNLNLQPTLTVRPGFRLNVFLTKDVTLEPYEG